MQPDTASSPLTDASAPQLTDAEIAEFETAELIDVAPYRSVSQLTTYLSCGEQYRLSKIAKAPRTPAAWLLQGIAFHSAVEHWEREGRKPDLGEVHAVYDMTWQDHFVDLIETNETPLDKWLTGSKKSGKVDADERYAKGTQQVSDYITWALSQSEQWRIATIDDGPALELRFEILVYHNGVWVKLLGYIDQVVEYRNGAIRPRDLKTGTRLPESPVQLGVYALALREQFAVTGVWHGDYYMAKNTDVTKPYDLAAYTLDNVSEWFAKLNTAIEAEVFIPNPGSHCRVCDVEQWCSVKGFRKGQY